MVVFGRLVGSCRRLLRVGLAKAGKPEIVRRHRSKRIHDFSPLANLDPSFEPADHRLAYACVERELFLRDALAAPLSSHPFRDPPCPHFLRNPFGLGVVASTLHQSESRSKLSV